MPSVCFYFQVHQPYRVRRFSYFDSSPSLEYFDEDKNREIMQKVAKKCYLPTNRLMLDLIRRYQGDFRISYAITGVALEQMEKYSPETLDSFVELAETGCVEFVGETYYHSLSALYDRTEFVSQVEQHSSLMQELFGVRPRVFRNTELIYSDEIGRLVSSLGYKGIIAEGCDDILGWQSPNFVYSVPGQEAALLLKNYKLSDDIAFRFSNRGWEEWPLTSEKFASWVSKINGCGDTLNLFMDYETFGEHQWDSTGIFQFMEHLPEQIFRLGDWNFKTPSQVIDSYPKRDDMSFFRLTSWADVDRDISAWRGNDMQAKALKLAFDTAAELRRRGDSHAYSTWRKLLTSDHFYYMCTKWFADGDVHAYFSPYESPYDAFVNYMNALRDFRKMLNLRSSTLEASLEKEVSSPAQPFHNEQFPRIRPRVM